ncbi:fumarylacetoacetate hydrolase family protein [Deinococcus marmoris]|uniref:2,4-diketo-3-deoxy-L-fuconate hydrolase n=1 Tax=Deinococcus marmoris TaxID=249408 RepID=A0A1U7NR46_9DEIO|nr:fumarylacetoacetate hydrolase family protein [Deinococcus marmoris]OLV15391.1 2,4-diketo-3-deoxy-L-fuconate hydrolase [Deinococcus marmoris]
MRLLRFGPPGEEKPGLLDAQGQIRDLSGVIPDLHPQTLGPDTLERIRQLNADELPAVAPDVRLGACVGQMGKFVCVGLNYHKHAQEAGMAAPAEPILFLKANSAVQGPHDDVILPRGSVKSDWEVELGVVLGTRASYVSEAEALSHVAGYCVVNDLSEREYQLERGGTWDKGKGCDTFGPIGPWLVTPDEVPDPQNLRLWLDVDGVRQQDGNTSGMIFGVAFLISYISRFMTLHPGDVIATGTPEGVGMGHKPQPIYLRDGQTMRLGIDGLGEQRQRVRTGE